MLKHASRRGVETRRSRTAIEGIMRIAIVHIRVVDIIRMRQLRSKRPCKVIVGLGFVGWVRTVACVGRGERVWFLRS